MERQGNGAPGQQVSHGNLIRDRPGTPGYLGTARDTQINSSDAGVPHSHVMEAWWQ
jgi:hypothetical protein